MSTKIPGKEMKYSMQSYNGSRTHNVTKNKEKYYVRGVLKVQLSTM